MDRRFRDRREAGRALADALRYYRDRDDVLVLGLPRGGVPVAFEVARALRAPLDVFLVRKLGVPGHEELAMGAIASGGVRWLNRDIVERLHLNDAIIDETARRESRELARRERDYRAERSAPVIENRTVILVDDGLATGASMRAAVTAVQRQRPRTLVVGVPVGAPDTCEALRAEVDELVCVETPTPFRAVGQWYDDFTATDDDEVRACLTSASER